MVNLAAKDLGKALGLMSREQSRLQENIYPDDPDAQLLLQYPTGVSASLSASLVANSYADNSFILDHPVLCNLNSSSLLLDGGYRWDNYLISAKHWWRLEGNLNDSIGSNNGSWVGTGAYAAGITGSGADFSPTGTVPTAYDTGNNISISAVTITTSMSVSFWIRVNSFTSGYTGGDAYKNGHAPIASDTADAFDSNINLRSNNNTLEIQDAPGTTYVFSIPSPATGVWYHFVIVFDSSETRAYRNGVALTPASSMGANSFLINAIGRGYANLFLDGVIDEFVVWDRLLTAGEVLNLYNTGSGRAYPSNSVLSTTLQVI